MRPGRPPQLISYQMWGIPAADAVYAWDRPSLDPVLRSLSGALFPRRTTALRPSSPASMAEVVGLACEGPTNAAFSELPLNFKAIISASNVIIT